MTIVVEGLASHAGVHPEQGVSAIAIASLAIADLVNNGWHGLVQKNGKQGASNVGVIHGGQATNVVTDLATYGFDEETGEMTLGTMHPGVTLDDVRAHMGWEPRVATDVAETPPPTPDELRFLREELDPDGIYTK